MGIPILVVAATVIVLVFGAKSVVVLNDDVTELQAGIISKPIVMQLIPDKKLCIFFFMR
jgi:hypothetical protein